MNQLDPTNFGQRVDILRASPLAALALYPPGEAPLHEEGLVSSPRFHGSVLREWQENVRADEQGFDIAIHTDLRAQHFKPAVPVWNWNIDIGGLVVGANHLHRMQTFKR